MMELLSMYSIVSIIKKHKIISIVVVVIIIILILSPLLLKSQNNLIYTVRRENLINTVLVNGTYTIASQTQVPSPTNGVITQLFVNNGAYIKKGDPLFHVASTATADQQKAAYANYLAASSAVQADNATLYTFQSTMYSAWKIYTDLATNSTYQNSDGSPNNSNRVLTEFTTAQDNWLAAEAQYKNQQSVIGKDQAALANALQLYNETQSITVNAPIAGKVVNLADKINDQVTAIDQAPVLVIADFTNPTLVASVDQVNIPRLQIGQKASIVFDALPDQIFDGIIDSIDTTGTKVQGTVTFNVRISVKNISPVISPNMTASITIETGRKNNVLTIPNDAIIQQDGKSFVQSATGNHPKIPIELGLKGTTKTALVSGLSEGDKIIEQQ